jgi:LysW-gamma-L-lysine carboxypeptidase
VKGLVAIPSEPDQEAEAVAWLVGKMRERGFHAYVDDAGDAVGEIGDGPVRVTLFGHIDTVPGDIPVQIEGGDLTGRGAVDAKGPLAAFVAAATLVLPGVRVTVVGAVGEETPSSWGARLWAKAPAPDWCIVGEPSGWDAVTVGYKGRLLVQLWLERAARHGAAPGPTISEEAILLWSRLRDAADRHTPGVTGFEKLDCRLEHIRGVGRSADGVVEKADITVGYRIPPGLSAAEIENEARSVARDYDGDAHVVEVDVNGAEEPARTSRTTPLARAFVGAIADAGGKVTFKVKSGTSDMNILAPAWGCPMVAYGPGDSRYDHTPMERLSLADYARSIRVLQSVLARAHKPII